MEGITMQYLVEGILTILCIIVGFLLRKKDEDQQTEINNIKKSVCRVNDTLTDLPKEYVLKVDYKDDVKEVKDVLSRIETKLDTKADRV
jgi:hypothetical protein